MRKTIENYRNLPGQHCGSTAMRNLVYHYCDLDLPEAAIFGLGAGIECCLLAGVEDSMALVGRSPNLEQDIGVALGLDYVEQIEANDESAWQIVREEIVQGRPTMLSGDVLYLDYREFKVHFPAHRFVLLGFDDDRQQVTLADRMSEKIEICSYEGLRKSRNPPDGFSTVNLWGKFEHNEIRNSLVDAGVWALKTVAARMLGKQDNDSPLMLGLKASGRVQTGVEAIRALPNEIEVWQNLEDPSKTLYYNSQVIEKFGNGGGFFRSLYAGFLQWAKDDLNLPVPSPCILLAHDAADKWTALADCFYRLSKEPSAKPLWGQARRLAAEIAVAEEELFCKLDHEFHAD